MSHKTKAHLFKTSFAGAEVNLAERLVWCAEQEIDKRARVVEGRHFRLDDFTHDASADVFLLNIIRLRLDEGPGRASLKKHVEGFNLERDEGFAEETAVLYHPDSESWVIQYNHHGPRAATIAQYVNDIQAPFACFDLAPVWRTDVMQELRRRPLKTKLQIKIHPQSLGQLDKDEATGLFEALKTAQKNGADHLELVFSVRRGRTLGAAIDSWISWFSRVRRTSQIDAVEKFILTAKGDDLASKPIDLMAPKLEASFEVQAGRDRRLPLADRWNALKTIWDSWKREHSRS